MRIGIPWWIGAGSPVEGIEQAASIGADFLEISLDAPWPDGLDGGTLREVSEDTGVGLGFHGPWRTQSLAHPREALAQAARSVAHTCIDLALTAGGEYIVFHVDARDFGGFPDEGAVDRGLETAHASLRAMSASAGDQVELLVENTSSPMGTPDEVAGFLDPLPEVGFCYDPGHAVLAEARGTEGATDDTGAWATALGDRFELLHLMDWADTQHGIVDHLLPGAGDADVASILKVARDAGCERTLIEGFFTSPEREEATLEDLDEACQTVRSLL